MVTKPLYEFRQNENEEWQEISELELMDGLYKYYHRATPAIKEMITGKELRTPDAVYRLKWQIAKAQSTKKLTVNRRSRVSAVSARTPIISHFGGVDSDRDP